MNIWVYENILRDMKLYNANHSATNYGNVIVPFPTTKPTYPYTVFDEIRNVAVKGYSTPYEKVSSNGYRVDIYAKTKGNFTKQTIAREIAKQIDDYLTNYVGLLQLSFNVIPSANDDSIYHIAMVYEKSFHENRAKFI